MSIEELHQELGKILREKHSLPLIAEADAVIELYDDPRGNPNCQAIITTILVLDNKVILRGIIP